MAWAHQYRRQEAEGTLAFIQVDETFFSKIIRIEESARREATLRKLYVKPAERENLKKFSLRQSLIKEADKRDFRVFCKIVRKNKNALSLPF